MRAACKVLDPDSSAQALGATEGWVTTPISQKTHPVYFNENGVSQSRNDDMKRLRGATDGQGSNY